jgi:hypothetical protein
MAPTRILARIQSEGQLQDGHPTSGDGLERFLLFNPVEPARIPTSPVRTQPHVG